ncbi:MAG: hypothetical protein B7Z61_06550 [Acidobacteria bacterium 37-71-11]|nr:MAG: hypothetical protein B7Z61_06550 [Acidobacteria bacterium 37-71-11]
MNAALTRNRSLVLALLVFALSVRIIGLNFDQSHFYHPDERRIAEAVTQLSLHPLQLNPHFFAYGSFPFYVTKLVTATLANFSGWFATYDGAVLTGRALSALWGTGTVLLLVLLGRRLYGARTGLLAGALLAGTVLHVQNSHFATNDVPLTFLVLLALTLMVEIVERGRPAAYAAAGAAIGLAVATKFSALPLLLPLAVAAAMRARNDRSVRRAFGGLTLACTCAAAAFAGGEPYALLDARGWLHDILEQSRMVRHAGLMPYTTQYVGVPKVFYDLREMVVWGMGPLLGLAALAGTIGRFRRGRTIPGAEWVLLAWVVPFFAITCSFDVKFVRYLLPIYPLVVLWGAAWLQEWAGRAAVGRWARGAVVAGTALYLLAFLAIYTRPHSAVTASEWFYTHAAPGSRVLIQDWDEGFPFSLPGRPADRYKVTAFGFYGADGTAKIKRLADDLAASEWLVLQTKRLYGAVTRAPARYPLTNNFFRELFAGDLGYTLVKDVASRPSLFGIELPDELADESFSVYDHPKALIFRNTGRLAAAAIEGKVLNALPSRPVSRSDMLLARAGGIPAGGGRLIRSSLAAMLACALLLEVLGLAAFALARWALPPRPGLYALAKVVGVLVFAYIPWLAVSLGVASFAPPVLWTTLLAVVAAGWFAHRRWREAGPPRAEVVAIRALPAPACGEPRDLLGREADGLLVPQHALPGEHPAPARAVVLRLPPHVHLLRALHGRRDRQDARDPTRGDVQPRHCSRGRHDRRGAVRGRGAPGGRVAGRRRDRGPDAAARQPLRSARAAGAARGQLRLLLGHLPRHPQHDQRVPVLELRLRRSARARAGPPLGRGVRRPRDRVARPAGGAHPPPPAHRLGRAAGPRRAPAGCDHGDQRLEPADLRRAPAGAPRRRLARARHARRVRARRPHRRHLGGPAGHGRDRRRRPGVPAVLAAVLSPCQAVGRRGRPVRAAR